MKKAKIVASIVLAAALGTTMFAAACGKEEEPVVDTGKEFIVSEYAHALDSKLIKEIYSDYGKEDNVHGAFSTMTKLNYDDVDTFSDSNLAIVDTVTENDEGPDTHSYAIYDIKAGKEVVSGYDVIHRESVDGYYNDFSCFALGKVVDEEMVFELMGPDGKVLSGVKLSALEVGTLEIDRENHYTDEDDTEFDFFKMTYTKFDDEGEEVGEEEVFLCYAVDKDGEFTFKVVKEADTETPEEESEYPAGSLLGVEKEPLTYDEYFPDSNWEGIEVNVEGLYSQTYTFYKNDAKISSVEISNAKVVGYVGDYMYYYEMSAVSSEATEGYNYEYVVGGAVIKANYTLFRFDFINGGEVEEVETDYIVTRDYKYNGPLYNYTTKTFDKLVVTAALKKENGVATSGQNNREYVLVLDDDFKVSADLSAKNVTSGNLIKLKDGRYLAGNLIVDDDLNTVAKIPGEFSISIWAEKSLIVCESTGREVVDDYYYYYYDYTNTMIVDFDGKVVVEPSKVVTGSNMGLERGSYEFYGDVAYNSSDDKLYSAANPSGIKLDKLVKFDEDKGEMVVCSLGLIIKYVPVEVEVGEDDDTDTVMTYSIFVYDLTGKQIGSTITNVVVDPDDGFPYLEGGEIGGKIFIAALNYTDVEEGETATNFWVIG